MGVCESGQQRLGWWAIWVVALTWASCHAETGQVSLDAGQVTDAGEQDVSAISDAANPQHDGRPGQWDDGHVDGGAPDSGDDGGGGADTGFEGIWAIWSYPSADQYPFIKGSQISCRWADIEPAEDQWDWSRFDSRVNYAVNQGWYVGILVYQAGAGDSHHAQSTPDWVFDSVPRVDTGVGYDHPYYKDPDYKPLVYRMFRRVKEHIMSYPSDTRSMIKYVFINPGVSGDPMPYQGDPVDSSYDINPRGSWWKQWTKDLIVHVQGLYAGTGIAVLINFLDAKDWDGTLDELSQWKVDHVSGPFWWKATLGHRHSEPIRTLLASKIIQSIGDARGLIRRDELDAENSRTFRNHPEWELYWTALVQLSIGVHVWNWCIKIIKNLGNCPESEVQFVGTFFSKHAPYSASRRASESPDAWCALRDVLDAADLMRFPESVYGPWHDAIGDGYHYAVAHGPYGAENHSRMARILAEFTDRGAMQEDPARELDTPVRFRVRAAGPNDVSYRLVAGNCDFFLSQIDPQHTSIGWWRQGPPTSREGRYCRSFLPNNPVPMRFRSVDGFLNGRTDIKIKVRYLDDTTGSFIIRHHPSNTEMAVTLTNSGTWETAEFDVADAVLDGSGPDGADVSLVPVAGVVKFHMVMIEKMSGP